MDASTAYIISIPEAAHIISQHPKPCIRLTRLFQGTYSDIRMHRTMKYSCDLFADFL